MPKNFHIVKDSILIAYIPFEGNPGTKKFYKEKQKIILTKNINTGKENTFFDFPTDGELIFDNQYFNNIYTYSTSFFNNYYSLINSNGKYIYKIDAIKGEVVEKNQINFKDYAPLKLDINKRVTVDEDTMNLYRNSSVWDLFESEKFYYVLYNIGYQKDFLIKYKKEHKDFPFRDNPKINFSFARVHKDNLEYDLLDLKNFNGLPVSVTKDDKIIIQKFPTEDSDFQGYTILYKCQVTDNEI